MRHISSVEAEEHIPYLPFGHHNCTPHILVLYEPLAVQQTERLCEARGVRRGDVHADRGFSETRR